MPIAKSTALAQIDAVFARIKELDNNWEAINLQEVTTLACATIKRLAPPGSAYLEHMPAVHYSLRLSSGMGEPDLLRLQGILRALRADYEAERLQSFKELLQGDLFSDFLEMAEYFLQEGYKDAAAVIAGGVLEQHLRKLCGKHAISIPPKPNLNTMNTDLAAASIYGKNEHKQVTGWAALRNDAAHGVYGNYTVDEVKIMTLGIRGFISRNPA